MIRQERGRKTARLRLEHLEDRCLLSSTPTNIVVPNDPQFSSQYALQNTGQNGGTAGMDINATGAWDVTTGTPSMTVAVLDTGVDYDHPDLYDNIWINQAEIPRIPFTTAFDQEYGLPLGSSRYSILQDVYHDGAITFADLNNPINQGPGKITALDGAPYIDASDILTPMVTTTASQPGQNAPLYDTGAGGWSYTGNTQDGDTLHPNDFIGWNFVNNNNNPMDENGHGTNVAGVIGAMGNDSTGVACVAWNTSIMVVQFEDASGNGTLANLIDAINYATEHGAKILNNSWGGVGNVQNVLTAIQQTQEAGDIFVMAAGNGATNINTTPTYPMSWGVSNVVSVAAVDDNGNLASFSNYGANSVDLAAPGVNILSTYPGKSYNETTGTSMAAPFVSGVMDLVWSEHPDWTAEQVIDDVMDTVTPLPSLQGQVISGGMVNAAAAFGWTPSYATSTSPPAAVSPPPVVTTSTTTTTNGPPAIISDTLIGAANTISELQVTFNQTIMTGCFTPSTLFFYNPSGTQIAATSVTAVAGTNNTEFDIVFPTQTAPGNYSLTIGPEVFNNSWVKMTVFQTAFTITSPPPPAANGAPSIISDSLIGAANTISELQVTFNQTIMTGCFTPSTLFFYNPNNQQIAATSVTAVAGTNNTEFDIFFPTQTANGNYSLTIGPEVFNNSWVKMAVFQTTLWIGPVSPPPPTVSGPPVIISDTLIGAANTIAELQVTFNQTIMTGCFTPSTLFFYNPSGQQIAATSVTPVAGTNNTEFDIFFPTQSVSGAYSLKIGPEVFNNSWVKMTVFQTTLTIGPVSPPPVPAPDVAPSIIGDTLIGPANTISEVQVTFSKQIMDGCFTPSTLFFYTPSGQQIAATSVVEVAGSNDTQFDIYFPTQTAPGTYSLKIGPEVFDNDWTKMIVFQTTFTIA